MSDPQALHAELVGRLCAPGWEQCADAARAVLELHKPQDVYPSGRPTGQTLCFGCDVEGFGAEHPEWPCSTVKVIGAALGVSTDG